MQKDLVAWIDQHDTGGYMAGFVSAAGLGKRIPATRWFRSRSDAKRWIEAEASLLSAKIDWVPAEIRF